MSETPPVINDPAHDPVAIRRQYLNHEANLRSLGSLYYLGAFIGLLVGLLSLVGFRAQVMPHRQIIGVVMILLGLAYWKLGGWLRDLDPRARLPANILACIGLIGFPIGTVINVYILYLLNSKKAAVVFSEEYLLVREATPEIKYSTSWVVIVLAILLCLFVLLALVAAVFGKN
jgi:hypothetical protein